MKENVQIRNDIETEIEKAVELCQKVYSRANILSIMQIMSFEQPEINVEKQICILKLDDINSQEEADLLVFHLTNHHGLIREASAQKINEFMKHSAFVKFFQTETILDSLLKAINDINPNICRLIIEILPNIDNKDYFLAGLYKRFNIVFEEIEKLKRSNWYTKKLFNLYWCLEALATLNPQINENIESILLKAIKFREYTIREKVAMVLSCCYPITAAINDFRSVLKEDDNFYVKRYSSQW